MKYLFLILLFTVVFISNSCLEKTDPYTKNYSGSEYFPLEVGNTWIYEVDSIIYDNKGSKIDTIKNIVKEVVSGYYEDNLGATNFIIKRYNKSSTGWNISDTWAAYGDNKQAIRVEDNLKFIKLVFPIKKDISWDGNEYFDAENTIINIAGEPIKMYDNWTYRYTSTDQAEDIGENHYENVATIVQVDYENSIQKRYSIEKYAKGTGLIYKNMIILNTQKIDQPNLSWEEKAEEGFILTQKLISFTKQ